MPVFIALLRAVNVGGTGKLPMSDLRSLCVAAGFVRVQTYIASGNLVLESPMSESKVKATLEKHLEAYAGKAVSVAIRSGQEMKTVLKTNPFPEAAPNRTVAIFLDRAASAGDLEKIKGQKDEQVGLGKREIYVHYGQGMADSKLKIPAAQHGTAQHEHHCQTCRTCGQDGAIRLMAGIPPLRDGCGAEPSLQRCCDTHHL